MVRKAFLLVLLPIFVSSSCTNTGDPIHIPDTQRTWISPQFWANRLQDWEIDNGEISCIFSGVNRNLYFLTKEIIAGEGELNLSYDFALNSNNPSNKNYVGIRLGINGLFDDYRDNAVRGTGLDIGVTTNGVPFIGKYYGDSTQTKDFSKGNLSVHLKTIEENLYELKSVITINGTTNTLKTDTLQSASINGGIAIVSHFPDAEKRDVKTTSFTNLKISGSLIEEKPEQQYGPVLFNQFSVSRGALKYTAQLAPMGPDDDKEATFSIKKEGIWSALGSAPVDNNARTATFHFPEWDSGEDTEYRVEYTYLGLNNQPVTAYHEGTIPKDPVDKKDLVVAAFTGNNDLGFPNKDLTGNVMKQKPDFLFFSGDQIYEGVGGFGVQRAPLQKSVLDYLRKWYIFGWTYADMLKNIPAVSIIDDHDVYHGNIWGAGGISVPDGTSGFEAQDAGGYKMPAEWVNMVQHTQTSHLPEPYDPTPVEQYISVYYTDIVYGGVSFAVIEDRKFKSAPKPLMPEAEINNGWAQNLNWDPKTQGDPEGAVLLGERQKEFLNHWVTDWSYGAKVKVLLSQTIFANVATLPEDEHHDKVVPKLRILNKDEYPPDDRPVADMDSNGWPKTPRNEALKIIRKAFAFHIAGDQHLGSTIKYGINEYGDASYALCVPSVSNVWPRRWYPQEPSENPIEGLPKYSGDFEDGFGNKITVYAVSNPLFTGRKPSNLYDRATGYGIARINTSSRKIKIECWPRDADPELGDEGQYEGWPITIDQTDNYGGTPVGYLPKVTVEGVEEPVYTLKRGKEIIYSLRLSNHTFEAPVFHKDIYTVTISDPDRNIEKTIDGITIESEEIKVTF